MKLMVRCEEMYFLYFFLRVHCGFYSKRDDNDLQITQYFFNKKKFFV